MVRIRGEEEWARRCINNALGVRVDHHDDGSEPGMHDLEVTYPDRRSAAVEVTAAADAQSIELWNLVNGGDRWQVDDLDGGWMVAVSPEARARDLLEELPRLLRQLEVTGIRRVKPHWQSASPFDPWAARLGITHLSQSGTEYPGSIYPTIDVPPERSAGFVSETGDPLAEWLGQWLRQPDQASNLRKLARSGASERHLFLILPGFTTAPFLVSHVLMSNEVGLPTLPPDLPEEVTDIWAASTWDSGRGMRWSPHIGWQDFNKQP